MSTSVEDVKASSATFSSKVSVDNCKQQQQNGEESGDGKEEEEAASDQMEVDGEPTLQTTSETEAKVNHVNKENVVNGDIHSDKSGKDDKADSKETVLSNVDLNIKENGDDTGDQKESGEKADEGEEDESTAPKSATAVLDLDGDNAVDMDDIQPAEPKDEVENDPNFAVICSFLHQFGGALEIKYSIWQLKMMFEDYSRGMNSKSNHFNIFVFLSYK